MYPVSQDFHNQMKAQTRRIHAKIQVDYTDPFIDQSIQVSANENANYSYPEQVADNIQEPYGKIASLDGSWVLDGTYVLAPAEDEADKYQMGWWGSQLSDENGNYTAPYPTLIVTFAPRPIRSLQVIADNKRKEWPVNFEINLYSNETLLYTENVTDNTNIFWSTDIERVNEVTKMELIITKWSHANRQVKILEFFTSIQEIYETDDILLINLLEEREVTQGSLPVGNISSNEIDIRLVNKNGKFDAGNRQSPLYQLLKPNRRIKAWLRGEPAQINPKPEGGKLWHFDTSLESTDGIKPLEGAVATLRPNEGRFGGAVAVEEGTTNLIPSPRWFRDSRGQSSDWCQRTVYSDHHWKVEATGTANNQYEYYYPWVQNVTPNTEYTFSFRVRQCVVGYEIRARVRQGNNGSILIERHITAADVGKIVSLTVNSGDNISLTPAIIITVNTGQYTLLEISDIQFEAKPFATSFVDGSRADGNYILDMNKLGIQPLSDWTIAGRFKRNFDVGEDDGWSTLFQMGNYYQPDESEFEIWSNHNGDFKAFSHDNRTERGKALFTPNSGELTDYFFVAVTHTQATDTYEFHIWTKDREIHDSWVLAHENPIIPYLKIGGEGGRVFNGLIDELLISPKAHTEEEIARWYNSNAPFYDTEIKEWVPLGTFWSGDWTAPEGEIYVQTTGRDRLELLGQSTYSNSQVRQNVTLYELAIDVLEDYGLESEEYFVDEELQNTVIPYACFTPQSHREALRKIAEASLGQCYCDRDGIIRLEGYSYLQSKTEPDIVITRDDYFIKDNPYNYMQIANYIEVETQPLRPAPTEEVYRSNEPVSINAGETISITAYYNVEPCIEAVASIEGTGSIADVTYYSWGADVKVTSSVAGEFELIINAKPLKVQGAEKVVAKDDDSIRENGMIKYTFPKNPLVQTKQQAQKIADNLLAYYKEPRRDLSLEWRGNPSLLLGDRVRIVDEYGGEDFFVTKQNIEYDGGLRVQMEGRKADGVERY